MWAFSPLTFKLCELFTKLQKDNVHKMSGNAGVNLCMKKRKEKKVACKEKKSLHAESGQPCGTLYPKSL